MIVGGFLEMGNYICFWWFGGLVLGNGSDVCFYGCIEDAAESMHI